MDDQDSNTSMKNIEDILIWLKPDDITTSLAPKQFIGGLSEEKRNQLKICSNIPGLVKKFGDANTAKPFIFMYIKPQPAKRGTRFFATFGSDMNLHIFDLGSNTSNQIGPVDKFKAKPKRDFRFGIEGQKKMKEFTVKQPFVKIDKCVASIMHPDESKLHPLTIFLQPFTELPDEIPADIPDAVFQMIKGDFKNMFLTPNSDILSAIQEIAFPTNIMRELGDLLAFLGINEHKLFFMINSMLPACMDKIKNTSLILRGENVVTRMMNTARNHYCQSYFNDLIVKLEAAIVNTNSSEEFLPATLEVLKQNPPPHILRLLMLCAGEAARNRFPEEKDAPLYGMSNIFLLRGLGPKLIPKNANLQLKYSLITMFFNFTNNPNVNPYVPSLQEYLRNLVNDIDYSEIQNLGTIPDEDIDKSIRTIFTYFIKQRKEITEFATKQFTPFKPGMEVFLDSCVKLLQ